MTQAASDLLVPLVLCIEPMVPGPGTEELRHIRAFGECIKPSVETFTEEGDPSSCRTRFQTSPGYIDGILTVQQK